MFNVVSTLMLLFLRQINCLNSVTFLRQNDDEFATKQYNNKKRIILITIYTITFSNTFVCYMYENINSIIHVCEFAAVSTEQ